MSGSPDEPLIEQITRLIGCITRPTILPENTLRRYGLLRDPFTVPLTTWVRTLISITGEREVILAALVLCRALGVPWSNTDLHEIAPSPIVVTYNRHRVFLVALILADKYHTDDPYKTGSWASRFRYWDAGLLLAMELAFLDRLQWRMGVTPEEFNRFLRFLRLPNIAFSRLRVAVEPAQNNPAAARPGPGAVRRGQRRSRRRRGGQRSTEVTQSRSQSPRPSCERISPAPTDPTPTPAPPPSSTPLSQEPSTETTTTHTSPQAAPATPPAASLSFSSLLSLVITAADGQANDQSPRGTPPAPLQPRLTSSPHSPAKLHSPSELSTHIVKQSPPNCSLSSPPRHSPPSVQTPDYKSPLPQEARMPPLASTPSLAIIPSSPPQAHSDALTPSPSCPDALTPPPSSRSANGSSPRRRSCSLSPQAPQRQGGSMVTVASEALNARLLVLLD
eukprot:Rmarinus@m.21402